MPVKKKKKRGKGKASSALESPPCVQVKELLRAYQNSVSGHSTFMSPVVEEDLKHGVDTNTFVQKFILSGGPTDKPVSLSLFVKAIRSVSYMKIREIYCWKIDVTDSDIIDLSLFLEHPAYLNVSLIELVDVKLSEFALGRLSRALPLGKLRKLVLDYNKVGNEGIANLLICLSNNTHLKHLSVNYCGLTVASGALLAEILMKSTIEHLEVSGNSIQCDGCVNLIDIISSQDLPLKTLLLADNGIDSYGKGSNRGPFMTSKIIRRWITCTQFLQLLDLRDNDIGDLAARELMDGLTDRKTAGLTGVQVLVTHKIDITLYKAIQALGKKPKAGKKKKKRKKK